MYNSVAVMSKLIAMVVLGGVLLTGCSRPHGPASVTKTADGMAIVMTMVTPPLHTGDNVISLGLTDSSGGSVIPNANIEVTVLMTSPRLPGGGATITGRSQGNGKYDVPIKLAVATTYDIKVRIDRPPLKSTEVVFPVEATQ